MSNESTADGWCPRCGAGNDKLGYAHLPTCPIQQTTEEHHLTESQRRIMKESLHTSTHQVETTDYCLDGCNVIHTHQIRPAMKGNSEMTETAQEQFERLYQRKWDQPQTTDLRAAARQAIVELHEALKSDHLTSFAESRIRRALIFLERYL